jgi:copper chaperone
MDSSVRYTVLGMSCGHCTAAVAEAVGSLDGVTDVSVDLDARSVEVTGEALDDAAIRSAIEDAGYEAV